MKDYVAKLKAKPEHVRKRIALGTSAGVTALIGVVWLTTMATSGAFAFGNSSQTAAVADSQDQSQDSNSANMALTNTNVKTNFSQLMGAVGAATARLQRLFRFSEFLYIELTWI